jgi:abortive infection bacteriophage resistance protein
LCNHPRVPFAKPAITLDEQVALLIERGMNVADVDRARHYLQFIGYYRLSGYWRYYADYDDPKLQRFRKGTTFESVLDLYIFDRKLRVLLSDAFERIEVAVKAEISQDVALATGPFWLCDPANFDRGSHPGIESDIKEAIGDPQAANHQHVFIKHFYHTYSDPSPPSWMIMEALSFGAISKIYKSLKGFLRTPVAAVFGVQQDILESWLHALAFGRNVCAHHCRVWNRKFTIKPKIPKPYQGTWPVESQNRLYVLSCIIHHIMLVIADDSDWSERLRQLIHARPDVPLSAMGFPDAWEKSPFWGFPKDTA